MRSFEPLFVKAFGQLKTLREWAEDSRCMVNADRIYDRLRSGWPAEAAITAPRRAHLYEAFGECKTLRAWSEDPRCRVSLGALEYRAAAKWEFERCLTTPTQPTNIPRLPRGDIACFAAFGETKSLREWAIDPRCSVRYDLMRFRLRLGWALEDAIAVPSGKGSPGPYEALNPSIDTIEPAIDSERLHGFGEVMSLAAWAKDPRCKVTLQTLKWRLTNGMSLEDALTSKRMSAGPGARRNYEAFGERKTLKEWAKDPRCVVRPRLISTRLQKGIPMEEALTRQKTNDPDGIEAFGERKRLFEWAQDKRCKVSRSILVGRLRTGWTVEEAIQAPIGAKRPSRRRPKPPKPVTRAPQIYECFGERKTLTQWVMDPRCVVARPQALGNRLSAGIPIQEALTQPHVSFVPKYNESPLLLAFGEEKTLVNWAKDPRCVVSRATLNSRVYRGKWPLERALTEPERFHA